MMVTEEERYLFATSAPNERIPTTRVDFVTEKPKKPPMFITTTGPALSGYFAVMMWWNDTGEYDLPPFWEPYQSGIGRYATREEAIVEAKMWAKAEDLNYEEEQP